MGSDEKLLTRTGCRVRIRPVAAGNVAPGLGRGGLLLLIPPQSQQQRHRPEGDAQAEQALARAALLFPRACRAGAAAEPRAVVVPARVPVVAVLLVLLLLADAEEREDTVPQAADHAAGADQEQQ